MSSSHAPSPPLPPLPPPPPRPGRWSEFGNAIVRSYHAYGSWLVGIGWAKFFALSVLLLIVSGVLQNVPPFNLSWSTWEPVPPKSKEPVVKIETATSISIRLKPACAAGRARRDLFVWSVCIGLSYWLYSATVVWICTVRSNPESV